MANMFNMSALVTGFHWSTCSCMGSGFLPVCMELNYPLAMHNVAMDNSQFRSICRWFGFPFADMITGDDWHPWCRWVSPHFWWLNRPPSFGRLTCAHLQLVFLQRWRSSVPSHQKHDPMTPGTIECVGGPSRRGMQTVVVQKQMDALDASLLFLWNSCQKLLRDFAGMHQQLNLSLWACPRVQTWGHDIRISQIYQ